VSDWPTFLATKGRTLNPDWSFNMDDPDARLTEPPDEVSLPIRKRRTTCATR
jgi:hypothetical protein